LHREDKFGDSTGEAMLINKRGYWGLEREDGRDYGLQADLLVDSAQVISLEFRQELYNYKSHSDLGSWETVFRRKNSQFFRFPQPADYEVAIRTADGRTYSLRAASAHTQLRLPPADSQALHQLLLEGGKLRFVVNQVGEDNEDESIIYSFTIEDADNYEAAYKRLGRLP
jgi:hypothetical protein